MGPAWDKKPPFWKQIIFFFPIQLFLVHVRSSILLFVFLLLLSLVISGQITKSLGGPLLFLDPEYLGYVGITSYFIVGFACGGFISAFNIASYLTHSRNFPFLATLSRPFSRYSLNNFILPGIFLSIYYYQLWKFHQKNYPGDIWVFFKHSVGFLGGFALFTIVTLSYFFAFGRDMRRIFGIDPDNPEKDTRFSTRKNMRIRPVQILLQPDKDKLEAITRTLRRESWETATYLSGFFKIRLARPTHHYNPLVLDRVFSESHFYAFLYSLITILSLIVLGLFREYELLVLPAASYIFLYLTFLMMVAGGLNYFFGKWAVFSFIVLYFLYNFLAARQIISTESQIFGLNYENRTPYNPDSLTDALYESASIDTFQDLRHHEKILNQWKKKVAGSKPSGNFKPPIIFIACSGGGSKAATWTFYSLSWADSLLGGRLLKHTFLFSGSSGGALGASYLRELYYRQKSGLLRSVDLDSLTDCIAGDILNPLIATMLLSDFLIPTGKFQYDNIEYTKDRGYAFEAALNKNTGFILDKKFFDYENAEVNASIPMMIFAPSIIEDGRRMIFCTQPLSFLSVKHKSLDKYEHLPKIEDVEYRKLFKTKNSRNISFLSVLRANATFPFVMPPIVLPTTPTIRLMDAGIRDNYGIQTTIKYIHAVRNWLNKNVSQVVILEVSDKLRHDRQRLKQKRNWKSAIESFFSPIGGIFSNITGTQVYLNEQMTSFVASTLTIPLIHLKFDLDNSAKEEISMSLHLTEAEKKEIKSAVGNEFNQITLLQLAKILKVKKLSGFHQK